MNKTERPLIIPIFIPHAGCPHRCVFCDQSIIAGQRYRLTPVQIQKQIRVGLKKIKPGRVSVQIAFYGGNFLGQHVDTIRNLLDATGPFIQDGTVNSIRFSTRPDTIDEQRLNLLEKHPITIIELGVQSMDDHVLKIASRGHSSQETEKAVRLLKQYRYQVGLQMMIGLPQDSPATSRSSAEKIARLTPDFVRIYPTVVLAGSRLAKWYQQGIYTPLTLDNAVELTKQLYLIFDQHHIPVVRMGLQASEELDGKDAVLAGPYHPAFGHLVMSRIFLDKADGMLRIRPHGPSVTFSVHPYSISRLQGIRKQNLIALKKSFLLESIHIQTDASLSTDDLRLV